MFHFLYNSFDMTKTGSWLSFWTNSPCKMATASTPPSLVPRQLSLPDKTFPPSIPLIISSQDKWNSDFCQLETGKQDPNNHTLKLVDDAVELLRSINKPLAVLSICGPYRSGKSYFISRALGSPGAFKLGHSMQACTRGIWMATTVLECQDFTTVLLDTEGIDAGGASETMAMSLLTLTTLLSSFLIYNSKKVPQKVDLDKMRCFSQLSASLLAQCGESMSNEAKKAFFPNFLWLLRDVHLKMTDREGKELAPTKFLHTRVLASDLGELTNLGKSLVSLFPSLECATLPIPSTKRDIIRGIVEQQDKLKPAFNAAIDALIQQIFQKVSPKKAVGGTATVNGKALAALAGGYVEAVNRPGALPDLDQGWQAVVRLELKEASYKLVREYEREMEEALEGNLPMEERNLLRIHQKTLNQKKEDFKEEIYRINPLHSKDEETQPLLDQLEQTIVEWSKPGNEGERKVTGGVLHRFIVQNFTSSKEQCEKLFRELFKKHKVQEKIDKAVRNSEVLDIATEVHEMGEKYNRTAVGPAAGEILEKGLSELNQLSDILKKIPGQPQNITATLGPNKAKLYWDPPEQNPEAVDEYVVYKRIKEGEWEEAGRTERTRMMVRDLKSGTSYEFQVIAVNKTMMSVSSSESNSTEVSPVVATAISLGAGALCSLLLPTAIEEAQSAFKQGKDIADTDICAKKILLFLGLSIVALPVSIALAPVTLPVFTLATAAHRKQHYRQDPEESDEESLDH